MELFQLANFHKCGMDNCDNGAYHIEDANGELVDEDLVDPSYPKVNNPYIPHYVSDTRPRVGMTYIYICNVCKKRKEHELQQQKKQQDELTTIGWYERKKTDMSPTEWSAYTTRIDRMWERQQDEEDSNGVIMRVDTHGGTEPIRGIWWNYDMDTDLDDAGGDEDDPVGELLIYYGICRENRGPGGEAQVAR